MHFLMHDVIYGIVIIVCTITEHILEVLISHNSRLVISLHLKSCQS